MWCDKSFAVIEIRLQIDKRALHLTAIQVKMPLHCISLRNQYNTVWRLELAVDRATVTKWFRTYQMLSRYTSVEQKCFFSFYSKSYQCWVIETKASAKNQR